MSSPNETIADIVAEMRATSEIMKSHAYGEDEDYIAELATRLEAAAKREEEHAVEHATSHAEAVARDNCRDCVHNPQGHNYDGGNSAAMREALLNCARYIQCLIGVGVAGEVTINDNINLNADNLVKAAIAALSAPPKKEGGEQ